ncbi:MAG: histidine triad nucleotide-binding protein [Spirochaetota bacterium]
MDCLFCKIRDGEIPSTKVFENDKVLAFKDINPKAPVHLLVIHKEHTPTISGTPADKSYIFADIFSAVREIAKQEGLDEMGYRVLVNNGEAAGQEVFHVHIHIFGGKEFLGPMLCP